MPKLFAAVILVIIFIVRPTGYNKQFSRIYIRCHIISHFDNIRFADKFDELFLQK